MRHPLYEGCASKSDSCINRRRSRNTTGYLVDVAQLAERLPSGSDTLAILCLRKQSLASEAETSEGDGSTPSIHPNTPQAENQPNNQGRGVAPLMRHQSAKRALKREKLSATEL